MASPTNKIQKAAHSITDSEKNTQGRTGQKQAVRYDLSRAVETVRCKGTCNTFIQLFRFRSLDVMAQSDRIAQNAHERILDGEE